MLLLLTFEGVIESSAVEEVEVSRRTGLFLQVVPNPARSKAYISFYLTDAQNVSLNVDDIAGKLIYCFADEGANGCSLLQPGKYEITWNGRDLSGKRAGYGIYLLTLKSGKYICLQRK